MLHKSNITIVIAEDHPIMRQGLEKELVTRGYTVVESVENGALALEAIAKHAPRVAVLDIEMPLLSGFEVINKSRVQNPDTKYIIMTYHKEKGFLVQAKNIEVDGYLLKEDSIETLDNCIEAVLKHHRFMSPSLEDGIEIEVEDDLRKIKLITPAERTIIRLVALGKTSSEISEMLLVSSRTVEKHRSNIITKLNLPKGVDALSHWISTHQELVKKL